MRVRCPFCCAPNELPEESSFAGLVCCDCGSTFNLASAEETRTFVSKLTHVAHFELIEKVGVGSYGSVWKARDTQLDRIVAIKMPRHSDLDESETERFLRDAKSAAQLRHTAIAQVYEVGRAADTLYIASQYIEGADLRSWMRTERMSVREAMHLVMLIAQAVQHAHDSGVVHRDLKPANIMMDLNGRPYVIDFGLAKRDAADATVTIDGARLGTPAYMSPEQARGDTRKIDYRSDVYALGVILFELVTGERPFRGDERMVIVQILRDQPPRPRGLNHRVPRDVETIILKCLQKDPRDRYQTAGEFAEDVHRYLQGEGIAARPPGPVARLANWCLRYERIRLAGSFSLLLIALFVIWEMIALTATLLGVITPPNSREAIITFGAMSFVVLPLCAWNSWYSAKGNLRAIWLGLVFSIGLVLYTALALSGKMFQAGGLLHDINVRLPIMSISGLASLSAVILHVVSLAAYYANRDILEMQAGSTRSSRASLS